MPKDPQQRKAYAWEGDFTFWAAKLAKDKDIRGVIHDACRLYRVPTPHVRIAKRNSASDSSYYDPNLHEILILPKHRDVSTLLHEAAHAITDWIIGPFEREPHSKEWLGVFITLLDRFKVVPRTAAEAHAKAKGLRFISADKAAPKAIRAAHARKAKAARVIRREMRRLGEWEF